MATDAPRRVPGSHHRSAGLLIAPFGDGAAVYDFVERRVSIVSALGAEVLAYERIVVSALAAELAALPDAPAEEIVSGALAATVDALASAGLLDRSTAWSPPTATEDEAPVAAGAVIGSVQAVLDERLAFRCADPELLIAVDALLGVESVAEEPTLLFDLEHNDAGGITVHAAERWEFPDRVGFEAQLPGVINDVATRSTELLVLHAGAVRTPEGRILVLPGAPDAGKSTLTGALVALGCDYLGDELVGIRPDTLQVVGFPRALALDEHSRRLLEPFGAAISAPGPYVPFRQLRADALGVTGDAGMLGDVVLPRLDPATDAVRQLQLTPRESLEALLGVTLNLPLAGNAAWDTLCRIAEEVPVRVLHHGGVNAAAAALLHESGAEADGAPGEGASPAR